MKKVKVAINEVITQTFEVEIDEKKDEYEQIRNMYKTSKLVVDEPVLIEASYAVVSDDDLMGTNAKWSNLQF